MRQLNFENAQERSSGAAAASRQLSCETARDTTSGAAAAWRLVQSELREEFPASRHESYVETLNLVVVEQDQLVFLAHSQTQQLWLESEARRLIEQRLRNYIDVSHPIAIRLFKELSPLAQDVARAGGLDTPFGGGDARLPDTPKKGAAQQVFAGDFSTFRVGASNQRAAALARMAASRPSDATRLILFYGEPGVGKTHLAEAICNEVQGADPNKIVVGMQAMAFLEEFQEILHSRKSDLSAFKLRMREPSVLFLDDVQHLAGKKVTEDEFFAVLSHLMDRGRQVILTADAGPEALVGFSERLRHRLRCATTCEIGMPDESLRLEILRTRVAAHAAANPGFAVTDAALSMIASRMDVSARELDGAVGQLVLEWEVVNAPISAAVAESALRTRMLGAEKRIMIDHVREAAAQHFQMSQQELLRRTRERSVAYPRQVAMYVACKLTQQSLPNIARYVGNMDHTTVLHARKKITKLLESGTNEQVRRDVDAVIKLARQLA